MPGFVSVLSNGRKRRTYTFSEAVLLGWAPDGGMFWPESVPHLDPATLRRWAALPYASLCAELLKLFIAGDKEMSESDIDSICGGAFERFGAPSTVEVRPLSVPTMVGKGATGASEDGYHVCELWHGPTLAFKDLGMAVLARTLGHLLRKRGERLTLLVGTSGDTGSSAMEAVRGMGDVLQLVVLYPLQGYSAITPTQEAQMAAVPPAEPHIHLVGVEGSSDELDVPMAACFQDATYRDKHSLGSVNSVNIIRLLIQAANFIYAYLSVRPGASGDVEFAVPSGAAGQLASGLLAVALGLPARLIGGTNRNDALHRVLSGGLLRPSRAKKTVSPSMDIQMPYNLWRILYFASRGDGAAVRRWRSDLAAGALRLPGNIVLSLSELLQTVAISDAETLQTIKAVHARGYTLDPHTAVGVAAALHHPFTAAPLDPTGQGGMTPGVETYDTSSAVICMACAHPVKFAFTVCEALGGDPATAVTSMPDVDKHPCVQQVAAIAASARLGYTSDTELPAGCCAVMRRADKEAWEEQLRELIEGLPGGAHHRPPPSGQLRSAL